MLTAALLPLAALTALGKTVLALVAATFIIWSLVTALSIPKRNPRFPENMGVYLTITVVLFVAQMTAVVWATGTQEVEEEKVAHESDAGGEGVGGSGGEGAETTPAETTETAPPETTEGTGEADLAAGKEIFAASCAGCHTLSDAGASGSVGPNLDETKPSTELVVDRVTNGKGVMPAFEGQLDEQEIQDVSAYVSSVAGQ